MSPIPQINYRNRHSLLTGLGLLVYLAVLARPSAVLTFGFIALAGILADIVNIPERTLIRHKSS